MAEEIQEVEQVQEPTQKAVIHWGLGRRKTAVARVRLIKGTGKFTVNRKEPEDYFTDERQVIAVRTPLKELKLANRYDVHARTDGGGMTGQAGAIVLGIARALVKAEPDCEQKLRDLNMLTRDPRMKERKKYGKKSARASFQFSKR